jgi:hypothetical protein
VTLQIEIGYRKPEHAGSAQQNGFEPAILQSFSGW